MTQTRTGYITFKARPHYAGYRYKEGEWLFEDGDKLSETFERLQDAEAYAQEALELDLVDHVNFYQKNGRYKKTKSSPYLLKSREELIVMAKNYRWLYKQEKVNRFEHQQTQWEAKYYKDQVIEYKKKADMYTEVISKWNQLKGILTDG